MDINDFQSGYDPLEGSDRRHIVKKGSEGNLFGIQDWREMESLGFYCAEKGVCFSTYKQQKHQQQPPPEKERPYPSLGLLSGYGQLKGGQKLSNLSSEIKISTDDRKLSTEEIMRVAGARYIEFSAQRDVNHSMLMHPLSDFALWDDLSLEERRDVELAQLLLSAAEKVGCGQFDGASRLLNCCASISSDTGNAVQRIVFYFVKALTEKIDRETGRITSKRLEKKVSDEVVLGLSTNPSFLACHRELPFPQVTQFAGIQAILEKVAADKKIHLIDLEIRCGVQWTVLMQALAERKKRRVQQLKVTAVGTTSKKKTEETGRRLENFAKSMNLNFSFKLVFVSEMEHLKEELFEIGCDEAVAVYSPFILRTMISRPSCLETLLGVMKKLKPSIMVVTEVEANHNSPLFVNRLTETLFFYSAYFDCLETCMVQNNENRMILEAVFGESIRNIVATEGEERFSRNVKIDVWRAFFARFGMVEIEFSESSIYQASLIAQQFACANSCTLYTNEKCLIVGWKGSPIHSLSAWKFHRY